MIRSAGTSTTGSVMLISSSRDLQSIQSNQSYKMLTLNKSDKLAETGTPLIDTPLTYMELVTPFGIQNSRTRLHMSQDLPL